VDARQYVDHALDLRPGDLVKRRAERGTLRGGDIVEQDRGTPRPRVIVGEVGMGSLHVELGFDERVEALLARQDPREPHGQPRHQRIARLAVERGR
jgi:hypothetical protein